MCINLLFNFLSTSTFIFFNSEFYSFYTCDYFTYIMTIPYVIDIIYMSQYIFIYFYKKDIIFIDKRYCIKLKLLFGYSIKYLDISIIPFYDYTSFIQ